MADSSLPISSCFSRKSEDEEKQVAEFYNKYSHVVKDLPQSHCWPGVPLKQYKSFWFRGVRLRSIMAADDHFTTRPGDIILATMPKVGTTWLKALAFAVNNRTDSPFPLSTLLNHNPHQCVPLIEMELYDGKRLPDPDGQPSPRLFSTHLPYPLLPKSILDPASDCKIVYLCRNPRDTVISLWHFFNGFASPHVFIELEQAVENFLAGTSFYGPFWDHVLGYWESSKATTERVLFMRYEEMLRDPLAEVKRLAAFMGRSFSTDEERDGMVEKIVKMCSFQSLSKLKVNQDDVSGIENLMVKNSTFFRKGVVGDWANYLTPEMEAKFDRVVEEKFQGSVLSFVGFYGNE